LLSQTRPTSPSRNQPRNCFYSYLQTLQVGIGPSFSVVLIGAATAKQVQATATTRTKVLTARVMVFSLHAGPLGAETLVAGL
jgi:hypothetical protein